MILYLVQSLRELIIPIISFFAASITTNWGKWALLLLVFTTLVSVYLKWRFTIYDLTDTQFRLHKGSLQRTKTVISHSRIQTVDLAQSAIERLLGLATLRIETPSGEDAEIELIGLKLEIAEELKRKMLDEKASNQIKNFTSKQESEVSVIQSEDKANPSGYETNQPSVIQEKRTKKITSSELRRLAVSSFNIAFIMVLATLFSNFQELLERFQFVHLFKLIIDPLSQMLTGIDWTSRTMIILEIVISIFVAWLCSIGFTYLKFYQFQLTRLPASLLVERGFFEKNRTSIQLKKIQAVRVIETPIRQWLGWVSVAVECSSKDDENKEKDIIFPFIRKEDLGEFFAEFLPEFQQLADVDLKRVSSIPYRRMIWVEVLLSLSVAGGVCYFWLPNWYWFAGLGILFSIGSLMYSWITYRDEGYALIDKTLIHRKRSIHRVTEMIHYKSIQYKQIKQSPFYRKNNLAKWSTTLLTGHSIEIGYIPQQEVEQMMEL